MRVKLTQEGYIKIYSGGSSKSFLSGYENDKEVLEFIDNGGTVEPEFTSEELAANEASKRASEIQSRLVQIDLESLRPLRAVANNNATSFDTTKLTALDDEATALRAERATL